MNVYSGESEVDEEVIGGGQKGVDILKYKTILIIIPSVSKNIIVTALMYIINGIAGYSFFGLLLSTNPHTSVPLTVSTPHPSAFLLAPSMYNPRT